MNPTAPCASPYCERDVYARGMCSYHYGKEYREGKFGSRAEQGMHSLSDIDVMARTATCSICGFTKIRVRGSGRGSECETKRANETRSERSSKWDSSTPTSRRRSRLKTDYGITEDEYRAMAAAQGWRCAICRAELRLVIDHCHDSGEVRELLCHGCNSGIGFLRDDPAIAAAAARYLARHNYLKSVAI